MQAGQESADEGWRTVDTQKSRKSMAGRTAARERLDGGQTDRELQAVEAKHVGAKRTQAKLKGRNREDVNSRGAGGGRTVYEQLRQYLRNEAPTEYVGQTVMRLKELAAERRFQAYLRLLPASMRKETSVGSLRLEWQDAVPFRLREKYEGLTRDWAMGNFEHQAQLTKLMYTWIITDNELQGEVEDRLRFIKVVPRMEVKPSEEKIQAASYLAAVQHEGIHGAAQLTAEQARLRDLCLQDVSPTSKLRSRTADETAALVMILNHEIEVPAVPAFLAQSMAPGELAVFEDLFKALEYSIYAHVAPGQRFFSNMAPAAILAQIHCGTEAAPAHKHRIEDFKRDLSRITLDMRARILKVTFKGRAAAVKWVGWQVPLASKLITLIDYDLIRERAKRSHELVMMDFYSFVVEVKKGALTSSLTYKMLTEELGLKVQELRHTASPTTGIHEMQWQVRVQASECPRSIEDKGYIVRGEVEVVIHHVGIHVNWPCRTCYSPTHPTRVCSVVEEKLQEERGKYTCTLQVPVLTGVRPERLGKGADGHERAIAKMEKLLRNEARGRRTATVTSPAGKEPKPETTVEGKAKDSEMASPQTELEMDAGGPPVTQGEGIASPTQTRETVSGATATSAQPAARNNGVGGEETGVRAEKLTAGEGEADQTEVLKMETLRGDDRLQGTELRPNAVGDTALPRDGEIASQLEGHVATERQGQEATDDHLDVVAEATEPASDEVGGDDDYAMEDIPALPPGKGDYAAAVSANKERIRRSHELEKAESRGRGSRGRRDKTRSPTRGATVQPTTGDGVGSSQHVLLRSRRNGKARQGGRRASSSPKRKAERHWVQGRAVDPTLDGTDGAFKDIADVRASSLSPKRLSLEKVGKTPDHKLQKFIHQFMFAVTGRAEVEDEEGIKNTAEGEDQTIQVEQLPVPAVLPGTAERHEIPNGGEVTDEDPGFAFVAVSSPTDTGKPLEEWLERLKGEVVDVAANGNCGWLAYFAALYNVNVGLDKPTTGVVKQVNMLKKRVINEMLANLVDEARLHPDDMRAEATALGCVADTLPVERIWAIGTHLAEQRARSVKDHVPMHYWVRTMHLKAMATHARETVYVLDVTEDGRARIQAYAYHDIKNSSGELVETGTVCPIQTPLAMRMLEELVGAGIRPPVLILRWSSLGNHFQAVHYKKEDYDHYASNIVSLAETRNLILVKHGWKALDPIGYDVDKTAKAAAGTLAAMRKQAEAKNGASGVDTRMSDARRIPRTIYMEVAELQDLEHTSTTSAESASARGSTTYGQTFATAVKGTEQAGAKGEAGEAATIEDGQELPIQREGGDRRTKFDAEGERSLTTARPTEGENVVTST